MTMFDAITHIINNCHKTIRMTFSKIKKFFN